MRHTRELALALIGLAVLGAAAYGSHVADGGFYSDDWANADLYRAFGHDYGDTAAASRFILGSKPLLGYLLPIPHAIFGTDPEGHLALAVVLGVLTAGCAYAALRVLGLDRLASGSIAGLTLLFPWSDSLRLWPTASLNSVAICLYLLGLILALKGLERPGRAGIAMHIAGVCLYVASILTYEVTWAVALASVCLYAWRSSWRTALRRWPLDILGVGAAVAYSASNTIRPISPLHDQIAAIPEMARGAATLLANALVPLGTSHAFVGVAILAIVGASAWYLRRGRPTPAIQAEIRTWLSITAGAALLVAAAYLVFLPSQGWDPLGGGLTNRINALAAIPMCALVYAIVSLLSTLVVSQTRGGIGLIRALSVGAAALIAIGYLVKLDADKGAWARATVEQERVLAALEALPELPPAATVYAGGFPGQTAQAVPVFSDPWSLNSAARIRRSSRTLRAYPVYPGATFQCTRDGVEPTSLPSPGGPLNALDVPGPLRYPPFYSGPDRGTEYGKAVMLFVPTRTRIRISSNAECRAKLGPLLSKPAGG